MRRSLASLLVFTALAATAAAAPPAAPPPAGPALRVGPPPKTLAALRADVVRVDERLVALAALAATDSGLRLVRQYVGYTVAQLSDPKRAATVYDLLEIGMDRGRPPEVREEAVVAILSDRATAQDPDLSIDGRKAGRPRNRFSGKVVKFLSDPDQVARALASRILSTLNPGARDPDVKGYDPRKKETWGNARAAWTRYLSL